MVSSGIQVEDIVDSGHTVKKLTEYLESLGAKSVRLVALLDKSERRSCDIKIDYLAFWVRILQVPPEPLPLYHHGKTPVHNCHRPD